MMAVQRMVQGRGGGMIGTADEQFLCFFACCGPVSVMETVVMNGAEAGKGLAISWWQQVSHQAVTRTCSRHKMYKMKRTIALY
jgi:hypothetical protein